MGDRTGGLEPRSPESDLFIDDPQNGGSEPGAYADALRHSVHIRISEHEPSVAPAGDVEHPRAGHLLPHGSALSALPVTLPERAGLEAGRSGFLGNGVHPQTYTQG